MGIFKWFSADCLVPQKGNPVATNFTIVKGVKIGDWVVVEIKYPDAITYGGRKILVYDSYDEFTKLVKSGSIDPHFLEDKYSPIARFVATEQGWELAKQLAHMA